MNEVPQNTSHNVLQIPEELFPNLPLDIAKIAPPGRPKTDVVIATGEQIVNIRNARGNITSQGLSTSRHAEITDPQIGEKLDRDDVFRTYQLLDPVQRNEIVQRLIERCDPVATCSAMNAAWFRRLSEMDVKVSGEVLSNLLRNEHVPEAVKALLRGDIGRFANMLDEYGNDPKAVRIAQIQGTEQIHGTADAIAALPEFRDREAVLRFRDILVSLVPVPEEDALRFSIRYREPESAEVISLTEFPDGIQQHIRDRVQNNIDRIAQSLMAHMITLYGSDVADMLAQGIELSPAAPELSEEEGRERLRIVIDRANSFLPPAGDRTPESMAIRRALNFIATGMDDIVVVGAEDATYFMIPVYKTVLGFLDLEIGEYVALSSSIKVNNDNLDVATDVMLEEVAHKALRTLYGTEGYAFFELGDLRHRFLEAIIATELSTPEQMANFVGGELRPYQGDEYLIEVVAKTLKLMAQGKWGADQRRDFKYLTAFVEDIVLPDYRLYVMENRTQSHLEVIEAIQRIGLPENVPAPQLPERTVPESMPMDPFAGLRNVLPADGRAIYMPPPARDDDGAVLAR